MKKLLATVCTPMFCSALPSWAETKIICTLVVSAETGKPLLPFKEGNVDARPEWRHRTPRKLDA